MRGLKPGQSGKGTKSLHTAVVKSEEQYLKVASLRVRKTNQAKDVGVEFEKYI